MDPERSCGKNIECLMRALFTAFGEHFALFLGMAQVPMLHSTSASGLGVDHGTIKDKMMEILAVFAEAIRIGKEKGEIGSPVDNAVIARYITGMVRSVFFKWSLDGKVGDLEPEISSIVEFAMNGIAAHPQQS